ncbi:hypothetical protein GQR58_025308 [Nymphon striatum]|nr:hypothetical protein GQR58_025308 [Nymphon striatum]
MNEVSNQMEEIPLGFDKVIEEKMLIKKFTQRLMRPREHKNADNGITLSAPETVYSNSEDILLQPKNADHLGNTKVQCLRVQGSISSDDFFVILAKFAGQRSVVQTNGKQSMYIFGNASLSGVTNIPNDASTRNKYTLVSVDRSLFLDLYGNRSTVNKDEACQKMMGRIGVSSYNAAHFNSCDHGNQDLMRSLPCDENGSCSDQPKQYPVVPDYQFTFEKESATPRYWYVAIVACVRDNISCEWKHNPTLDTTQLKYDLWLVNGDSFSSHHNLFTYQFSFDIQSIFMLLLLLLAKGWPITRNEITWKPVLFGIWILYTLIHFLLHVWKLVTFVLVFIYDAYTEIDIIEDIDEYQTLPGWLNIGFRLIIVGWFLVELRNTMILENDSFKLQFYLHFGAGIPLILHIPAFCCDYCSTCVYYDSSKVIDRLDLIDVVESLWARCPPNSCITCSADFLAFAITSNLLWPTRSEQYFQLAAIPDAGDELEEFNEAPHNVIRSDRNKAAC